MFNAAASQLANASNTKAEKGTRLGPPRYALFSVGMALNVPDKCVGTLRSIIQHRYNERPFVNILFRAFHSRVIGSTQIMPLRLVKNYLSKLRYIRAFHISR